MDIDPKHLPSDATALQQMVLGLLQELDAKERRLTRVQHLLEQLLRWRYGQKRERVDENQLFLFAARVVSAGQDQAALAALAAQPDIPTASSAATRKGKGHGRRPLPQSLERRRVVYDLDDHQRRCPHCQGELRHIGEETSERLEYVPASLLVIEEACQKYACRKGCTVVTAAKPITPIEKGRPGPGLLAHIAVSKYGDHLPLHRQEGIFQRQGVELSRKTMCDWMQQCAELVRPLFEEMKQRVLRSKVIETDDTPVAVLDAALPRTRTGRI
jgi:transposase